MSNSGGEGFKRAQVSPAGAGGQRLCACGLARRGAPTTLFPVLPRYFASLPPGKIVLWCYLIWYVVTVVQYFDPAPSIWLNSLGISAVIGFALVLSVGGKGAPPRDRWQTFRLFMMPFCVSSFSSLIKGHGFVLIFPPRLGEFALGAGACAVFVALVFGLRRATSGGHG